MAITKCINSESKQYKPVLTDKLVLDAVPTVNSLNSVTSDAVARAIAGASGEVPQVTENDNGKVLTAIYDAGGPAVEWAEPQGGGSVTTVDKAFTVGVNGTGLPITVDCANASETTTSVPVTEDSQPVTSPSDYVRVYFPLSGLSSCDLGANTATLTVPNSVSYADLTQFGTASMNAFYYNSTAADPTRAPMLTMTTSPWNSTTKTLTAGTYTLSGSNPVPTQFADGILLSLQGGGEDFPTFVASLSEEMATWTLTYAGNTVVTGYTIKPTVIATPGSDATGKVLTVTDTQGNYGWQPVPTELPTAGVGKAGKVLTVSQYGSPTWLAPQTNTAGDGIDITSNEVSVKAGTGLEFDDILTPGGTANLVSQDIIEAYYDTYSVRSFAPLTSGLLYQMSSGLDVTLIGEFYAGQNTYAALYTLNSGLEVVNRLVLGNATGNLNPGSVVTFDTNNIRTADSNVTLSQVESNISNYRLGLLTKSGSSWSCATWEIFDESQIITSATTATCPEMIIVQDALCVADPLPAHSALDAGKVLQVQNDGTLAWVTLS